MVFGHSICNTVGAYRPIGSGRYRVREGLFPFFAATCIKNALTFSYQSRASRTTRSKDFLIAISVELMKHGSLWQHK
jgi:hypothetical protein